MNETFSPFAFFFLIFFLFLFVFSEIESISLQFSLFYEPIKLHFLDCLCRFLYSEHGSNSSRMESSEENYERGYQPSPSSNEQNDRSATGTPGYSPLSGDSFAYCRTYSETSVSSETIDDNSSCSEPSSGNWPASKPTRTVLSRLGLKPNKAAVGGKLEDQESIELGKIFFLSFFFYIILFSLLSWQLIISVIEEL